MNTKKLAVFFPLITLMVISCASVRELNDPFAESQSQFTSLDSTIDQALLLYDVGNYREAAAISKSIGQGGYSYYRMDEVLYLLGRCNMGLVEPEKAKRCFSLLRKYYSLCEYRFPDLTEWEQSAEELSAERSEAEKQESLTEEIAIGHDNSASPMNGPVVSNIFYETELRSVLSDIAEQTGVGIIPDPMVQGYVTLELDEVPLEEALDQLLPPLGFIFREMDGYYIVGQPSLDSPSFPILAETRLVELKYLKVGEAMKLLPKYYVEYLNIDEEVDVMTITAPPQVIENFMDDLTVIDTPRVQFMTEVMVVEMGTNARRMLGLDWDWTGTRSNKSLAISKFFPSNLDTSFFAEMVFSQAEQLDVLFDLRLALRALARRGKVRIRANPQVTTKQGREAVVRIGKESYYTMMRGPANYPYITLEMIETGITLRITPYNGIHAEINNKVYVEVSDVTGTGQDNLPVTSVRSVDTEIAVANGQTFGIGGLLLEDSRDVKERIPFLGDIPWLGGLFGTTETQREETEVVILITPHVLINPMEFDDL